MMGNLYYYDKITGEYSFVVDWSLHEGRMSYTCVDRVICDRMEEITGWEFNEKIFDGSDRLLLTGIAYYGKRGVIYDIDKEGHEKVRRTIKLMGLLDE
jgi:uncharacterized protein YggL (DUF469 family)